VQGTARTLFCVIMAVTTLIWLGLLLIVIDAAGSPFAMVCLLPLTAIAGLTFGASWTLMSVTISELFGLQFFSFNYSAVQLAPILATLLCPSMLVGRLFDREARAQHPDMAHDDIPCTGPHCFFTAFCILTFLSVLVRPPPCCKCPFPLFGLNSLNRGRVPCELIPHGSEHTVTSTLIALDVLYRACHVHRCARGFLLLMCASWLAASACGSYAMAAHEMGVPARGGASKRGGREHHRK
jgi:hypothetical protein